ncbi:MAG: SDR family NAD(P)-dependent oxidoreductase [Pseudomonadota bacterium]|nr:SDR family NAD(P)-dependent oxidoreductase [Pseudomonadota bacterium]
MSATVSDGAGGEKAGGELTGMPALVTGAGTGIGRATARRLAAMGAPVALTDIDGQAADAVARELRAAGAEACAMRADAADPDDHAAAVAMAVESFGSLKLAVNNAGVGSQRATVADTSLEAWNAILAVNLTGVFLGMRAQIPAILDAGGGAVVNLASVLGRAARANASAYVAAKHGVIGLTAAAAVEYSAQGVRVNAVCPGFIRTNMTAHLEQAALVPLHPIGRLGEPEEMAEVIAFLLSPRASFVTGAAYPADGGFLAL